MTMKKGKRSSFGNTDAVLAACVLFGGLAGSLICLRPEWAQRAGFLGETLARALLPDAVLLALLIGAPFFRWGRGQTLLAMAAKGALLAAETAAPMTLCGTRGWTQGLFLGLVPGFFTLTALMLLARQSLVLFSGAGKRRRAPDAAFLVTACVGAATLVLAACTRALLLPPLWRLTESLFS